MINGFQVWAMLAIILLGVFATWVAFPWTQWWTWLNPTNSTKGLVYGSVLKRDALMAKQHAAWERRQAEIKVENEKVSADRTTLNAEIQKLYESVNEPVPTPPAKTFFGGSTSTTKRKRIEPLNDEFDGVIGTIQAGVSATPEEYMRKFNTRRAGAKLTRGYKK